MVRFRPFESEKSSTFSALVICWSPFAIYTAAGAPKSI